MKNLSELIHYGSKNFNSELIKPIKNINWRKPDGGLWTTSLSLTILVFFKCYYEFIKTKKKNKI